MKRSDLNAITFALLALVPLSCQTIGVARQKGGYAEVAPAVAHEMMLDNIQLVVLDIRDLQSYRARHIAGSISTPLSSIEMRLAELLPYATTTVLVYSDNQEESARGARLLVAAGFRNIVRITGGLDEWTRLGYPTVSSE